MMTQAGEGVESAFAHEEAQGDQAEDGDEGISLAVAAAGVWNGGESLDEGEGGHASLLADRMDPPPLYTLRRLRPRSNTELPWRGYWSGDVIRAGSWEGDSAPP